ncbi:MAG: 4-alpha-glucanotransferase [Actinomycetes bacterium]
MADPALIALATAYGVATRYDDWRGQPVEVSENTLVEVLAALDVDAGTPEARAAALTAHELARWRLVLPATVVQRSGHGGAVVPVHCRHGDDVTLVVSCEDGSERRDIEQVMVWVEPVTVDGELRGEATFRLPADLPTGWHELVATTGGRCVRSTLVVVPDRIEPTSASREWGLAVQLYAARSRASLGIGDLTDLATLARWTGEHGGAFVLTSPLAAAAPVLPIEPSPYYPATRRYPDPIYLRVEQMKEYAAAGWGTRQRVDEVRADVDVCSDRIDRDAIWLAKRTAFALLWPVARHDPIRLAEITSFRDREGQALERFAVWCALAEKHGARWPDWPKDLRDPSSPGVREAAEELADRVHFYCWLQLCCDEQLAETQRSARAAGLSLGVVHDLPVGVNPGGADTWSMPDLFAAGVTVGAPADAFNQQGQDWQQPPWRPDRLAATGYAAYRHLLRAMFRHGGGLRVDHILGLFRLWWIPAGATAAHGTYVRYDAEAMLGILALEASRAGAVVIGEDLGTVEPGVRDELAARGILGSTVLWFENDGGAPAPPERWRTDSLATVTTHDLPTTAGLLELSHITLRADLDLLDRPVDEERAEEARKRDGWLAIAAERGLCAADAPVAEQVRALNALLAQSPCRLVAAALADLVTDPRQPNQPGTVDEYPNWSLALARETEGGGIEAVFLDDALAGTQAASLVQELDIGVGPRSVR